MFSDYTNRIPNGITETEFECPNQNNIDGFITALAEKCGVEDTIALHFFIRSWAHWEDSSATFNPMDTELEVVGATDYNSAGVKNYPDLETGIMATFETLHNGMYEGLDFSKLGKPGFNISSYLPALNIWGTGNSANYYPWTLYLASHINQFNELLSEEGIFDAVMTQPTTSPAPVQTQESITAEQVQNNLDILNKDILLRLNKLVELTIAFGESLKLVADPNNVPQD